MQHSLSVLRRAIVVSSLLLLATFAGANAAAASLSLGPAVITAKGSYGQSLTERLSISNQTAGTFNFEMIAQDIIVKDGKRVFVAAGRMDNSIAATAVFSPKELRVPPNTTGFVTVTLTIPQNTPVRAIAAVFHTKVAHAPKPGTVGLTASLGALITFNITDNVSVAASPVKVSLPTPTANLSFDDDLENTGAEPVIPKGVAAILANGQKLAGKAKFEVQRLLPGEKLSFHAEYAGELRSGHYKVLCTFQYQNKTATQEADFTIP
ncbi:MAG: hypothetical protein ACLGSD_03955 [Acidobacteriota bacterium]